jgi:hypothetical protein
MSGNSLTVETSVLPLVRIVAVYDEDHSRIQTNAVTEKRFVPVESRPPRIAIEVDPHRGITFAMDTKPASITDVTAVLLKPVAEYFRNLAAGRL